MISRGKVLELLKGLEAKTAKGQVRWNEGNCSDRFYVAFTTSNLYLSFNSPTADFDNIEIVIENADDRIVARVRIDEEDENWPWVKGLFDSIEGGVTGSDRVLEEIEGAIRSGGAIGIPHSHEPD